MANHLDAVVAVGLVQQAAINPPSQLELRIAVGQVQAEAIASASAFHGSWRMRGSEMANHLEALEKVGLAQQAAIDTDN